MATIRDIARKAGVAQGTVSNVLNDRGNVSSDKIRRVMEACQALGYVPSKRAQQLRLSQPRLLGVLLPNLSDRRHIDFFLSFKAYACSRGYAVRQYLASSRHDYGSDDSFQQAILKEGLAGLAVFAGSAYMMRTPMGSELRTIYAEHRPAFPAKYIGFDYRKAGEALALEMRRRRAERVVLLTGGLWSSNDAELCEGFSRALEGSRIAVTHVQTDRQSEHLCVVQRPEIARADAIVCSRLELAQTVRGLLGTVSPNPLPALYTLSPLFTLPEPDYQKYELNYRLLGHAAARGLLRQIEGQQTPDEQVMENAGLRVWSPPPLDAKASRALNIVALDSPSADNMRDIARLYTRQTGVPVNITIYSYDEMYEIFNNMRESAAFDVIRLDVTWLSFFAERILLPLEDIDPGVAGELGRFLEGTTEPYCRVGGTLYAFPSSPSTQMLFYRSDLFANAMCRRMYREQYGCDLRVPQTFDEYNRVAGFFTRGVNPESPVAFGSTLTMGTTAVTCSEYLARLFALQENLYDGSGRVRLSDPNYVRALEQLLEVRPYASPRHCAWWRDTAEAFAAGDTAMAIMYNNYASPLAGYASRVRDRTGFALMPGGRPVIGGGCMGVSRYTDQPERALNFIRWYCSEPIASAGAFLGGVSPCAASYDNYEIIDMYPWLRKARSSFTAARGRRTSPASCARFDERRFMSIIGMAVKNAFSGAQTPRAAMAYAQKLFDEQFGALYE